MIVCLIKIGLIFISAPTVILFLNIFLQKREKRYVNVLPIIVLTLWQIYVMLKLPDPLFTLIINLFLIIGASLYMYHGNKYVKVAFSILFIVIGVLIEYLVGFTFMLLDLDIETQMIYGALVAKILSVFIFIFFKTGRL